MKTLKALQTCQFISLYRSHCTVTFQRHYCSNGIDIFCCDCNDFIVCDRGLSIQAYLQYLDGFYPMPQLYFNNCTQQATFIGRFRYWYSFICQGTSTRRQRRNLFSLRVRLPHVTISLNHSKVEAVPLSTLLKDTTSEFAGLSPHYPFQMLNVKQGSCEYHF